LAVLVNFSKGVDDKEWLNFKHEKKKLERDIQCFANVLGKENLK